MFVCVLSVLQNGHQDCLQLETNLIFLTWSYISVGDICIFFSSTFSLFQHEHNPWSLKTQIRGCSISSKRTATAGVVVVLVTLVLAVAVRVWGYWVLSCVKSVCTTLFTGLLVNNCWSLLLLINRGSVDLMKYVCTHTHTHTHTRLYCSAFTTT